jgi:hypothetical protein
MGPISADEGLKPYLRYFALNEDPDDENDPEEYFFQVHVRNFLTLIGCKN